MAAKLTLVQKRAANSAVRGEDDERRFLADLRGLVWAKAGSPDGTWKVLAEKANLNPRTIARFASGETLKPQLFTIRRMINAIDHELTVRPKKK